ncbi:hypothetical protein [Actinomadura roseirufa]|uniref:hypothetical protein n=1 Tax=Actinomadura roseirufa TaxID=2094049 RepID=UPI00104174E1|nr:hypothetical protein [Actinomadura roseirufa]
MKLKEPMVMVESGPLTTRVIAGLAAATVVVAGIGIVLGGWGGVALYAVAFLLFVVTVVSLVGLTRPGQSGRCVLTERGFVHFGRGKEDVLPAGVIEAVGLCVGRAGHTELAVWYDHVVHPELPGLWGKARGEPGRIRLGLVDGGPSGRLPGGIPVKRVNAVRAFVERHRIAEWRNEQHHLA